MQERQNGRAVQAAGDSGIETGLGAVGWPEGRVDFAMARPLVRCYRWGTKRKILQMESEEDAQEILMTKNRIPESPLQ